MNKIKVLFVCIHNSARSQMTEAWRNGQEGGGRNLQIVIISRDTSSGTYESWQEKVLHNQKVSQRAQMQASSGAVVQAVSKNKYEDGRLSRMKELSL